MSILNDIISSKAKGIIKAQQQPSFPLRYDAKYGPYTPITSIEESYKKDFINLLLTSPGEWPMQPDLGVGLKHYLFEFRGSEKLNNLAPEIKYQLKTNLPVVDLLGLKFDYNDNDIDKNKVRIILAYTILETSRHVTSFGLTPSLTVAIEEIESSRVQAADLFNRRNSIISSVDEL